MEYKHFSHPHNLRVYQVIEKEQDELICSGCDSTISGSAFGCWQCKFFLHEQCGNAKRGMQHPSHPMHHLTLLPSTTYSAGTFLCNACGHAGSAFSLCCPLCDFDLHVHCASLPSILNHHSHFHGLNLVYGFPDHNASSYLCDICHKHLDQKLWSYNCFACNFHAHASCVTEQKSIATKPEPELGARVQESGSGSGSGQGQYEKTEIEDPVLKAQAELQALQLQMQMSHELANMMASFNLSSFV
ncbi:hypothetical protein ACOSP7_028612 [Xanthoceras sorbifolium]|uniref:DC1 domain-containing protein n=1 Tax=Xanthoceras sorbifolium TaxID=99658 RepID=A0ABQ8HCQ3_9ROSI|nr:hypothetical protein JRO89_XS12G0151100 [Xanthoceras sorbifolium]